MADILKGAPVSLSICESVSKEVSELKKAGITPRIAVVRAGARDDDLAYERGIKKKCADTGVDFVSVELPLECTTRDVVRTVETLGADPEIDGILVMRPLPSGVDDAAVCSALPTEKDVDGITAGSMAAVFSGRGAGFAPCTAEAVVKLLDFYKIDIKGARITVVGRSLVIGRPAAMLLMARGGTVTICHTATKDLAAAVKNAEIVVAAAGKPNMITRELLVASKTVIDVGINFLPDGRMVGDVDFDAALDVCSAVTPVPGGVGAVTSAVLMQHVVDAAKQR